MKLLVDPFETPVTEDWIWNTDVFVSENGTEQRVKLLELPRRQLQATYQTTDQAAARRMLSSLFMSQAGMILPAWHLQTPAQNVAIGDEEVLCNPGKTELRPDMKAFLFSRADYTGQIVDILGVEFNKVTLKAPASKPVLRASITPMWAMSAPSNAALTRGRTDGVTSVTLTLDSLDFVDPFLNPANVIAMDSFGGLPVLSSMPVGDEFGVAFDSDMTVIDYGAARTIRSLWKHSQHVFSRTYLVQRLFDRSRWYWWQNFADYCCGSQNPFYVPTFRPDFEIVGTAHTDTITLRGTEYESDYWGFDAFRQIAIRTKAGLHYASVTAIQTVAGNSVCTINPALPDDAAHAIDQSVSLLLKCRISDDRVSCLHDGLQTNVTVNLRTTDQ